MIVYDVVYGEEVINEPVLIDLIKSTEMQRLKKISQQGPPQKYYSKKVTSRFDHSMGVLILLKRLNAGLNEQIAGLLHDVSHTAFSHIVDWVMGDGAKENYQDSVHEEMIKNSNLPKILEKYNISYNQINKLEEFSLLDRPLPELCVDRVDYALREIVEYLDREKVNQIISGLVNLNGSLVFKDKESAELFSMEYARCQREHWAGNDARVRYYLMSDVLRKAIERKYIEFNDFKLTDMEVIEKVIAAEDEELIDSLKILEKPMEIIEYKKGIVMPKKFRWIDPVVHGENKKLSELLPSYLDFVKNEQLNSQCKDLLPLGWRTK